MRPQYWDRMWRTRVKGFEQAAYCKAFLKNWSMKKR